MAAGLGEGARSCHTGIAFAALAAFLVVTLLEHAYGKIEFDCLGVKFKGASGPVVLWAFCFLVIVGSMKLLW
jgi:hypothetical protein